MVPPKLHFQPALASIHNVLHLLQAGFDILGTCMYLQQLIIDLALPLRARGVVDALNAVLKHLNEALDIDGILCKAACPGILQTLIGRDGRTAFALNALTLLAAEELQDILHGIQILVAGSSRVAQTVGDGGAAVSAFRVGALGQNSHIPLAHHFGVVLQLGKDVPVAFQEHCALLGEEGSAGAVSAK